MTAGFVIKNNSKQQTKKTKQQTKKVDDKVVKDKSSNLDDDLNNSSIEVYMLTTVDNPFNPFTQFDLWNSFDVGCGYNTLSYLARIAQTSPELNDLDYTQEVNRAIDEILFYNLLGIYQKVTLSNFEEMKSRPLTEENKIALKMLKQSSD